MFRAPSVFESLSIVAILATSGAARADDKQVCLATYVDAQSLRKDGKLVAARQALLACSREVCPARLRADCVEWLAEVEREQPSVVLSAVGPDGRDRSDVEVLEKGVSFVKRLDGKAQPVDPGEHAFTFNLAGETPKTIAVVVRQGEHDRAVRADFSHALAPIAPSSSTPVAPDVEMIRPFPVSAALFATTAIVGFGIGGGFAGAGIGARGKLDDCKPSCDASRLDPVKRDFVIADVALATGVVMLGVATVLFVTRPSRPANASLLLAPRRLELRF